jgi:hypothetical protein
MENEKVCYQSIKYAIQNYETLSDVEIKFLENLSEQEKIEIIKAYNNSIKLLFENLL